MAGKYEFRGDGVECAMGTVYPAFDVGLQRDVGLVVVHPALVGCLDDHARFMREARVQSKLIHQNICALFDVFEHEGRLYVVRERVEGTSVRQMIDNARGPLATEEAVRIVREVLAGLHYAHGEGIVHRHITPSNVLVDTKGRARIMNFGMAEMSGAGREDGYMSPEQRQGDTAGPASDIYLLGLVLYEMLTGSPAVVHASGECELREFPNRGVATDAQATAVHVPAWLCNVVRKALKRNPEERFPSAESFAEALKQPCDPPPLPPPPPPPQTYAKSSTVVSAAPAREPSVEPAMPNTVEEKTWFVPGINMQFARIPPGSFEMGSNDADAHEDEAPVHRVTIDEGFWMGIYPVTQNQWRQIMGDDPSRFIGGTLPVESVEWVRCKQFCRILSDMCAGDAQLPKGFHFRLPTEAEWEYACRAGSTTKYCAGATEGDLARVAWYKDNSEATTHPVGSKEPNQFGLHDMHGNVWEWCENWYTPYDMSQTSWSCGLNRGLGHVVRGGSWDSSAWFCRSSIRFINCPHIDSYVGFFGFRIVCAHR